MTKPFATPGALRRSLTDRLSKDAIEGPWPLADLQRQFAYDRLLHRLYLLDGEWIVKGATALLARRISVRHTIDLDVYRAASAESGERDLRIAAAIDADDWFEFTIGAGTPLAEGSDGRRFSVEARLGGTVWARFHVDLAGGSVVMTGTPDDVLPLTSIALPGFERPGYRVYPLADHIADKVCAIFSRYGNDRPSTRYKDLVDLVSLAEAISLAATELSNALGSESERRHISLPTRFEVPALDLWTRGYAAEARKAVVPVAATLDEALAIVCPFLDPVLDETASGSWDPERHAWAASA